MQADGSERYWSYGDGCVAGRSVAMRLEAYTVNVFVKTCIGVGVQVEFGVSETLWRSGCGAVNGEKDGVDFVVAEHSCVCHFESSLCDWAALEGLKSICSWVLLCARSWVCCDVHC